MAQHPNGDPEPERDEFGIALDGTDYSEVADITPEQMILDLEEDF